MPPAVQTIEVIAADDLSAGGRATIVALCTAAFEEDFAALFDLLPGARHVLLREGDTLLAHACWVTRWLQPAGCAPLRTAYVEAVAVLPTRQRQGLGSAVMRRVVAETGEYELRALAPAYPDYYARLGWEAWRGPLAIRTTAGLVPTPDEGVMILPTRRTPPLDLDAAISAEWREGEVW